MSRTWRKQAVVFAAVAVALIGVMPFTNPGCERIRVIDRETGELRPATDEELKGIAEDVGDVAKVVTVAVGHPEFVPIVDVAVRVLALALAFFYGRKEIALETAAGSAAKRATGAS